MTKTLASLALLTALSAHALADTPPETPTAIPGEIIGRIEVVPGVSAPAGCQVLLEGSPLASTTNADGQFDIRNVPAGRWDVRVTCSGYPIKIPDLGLYTQLNVGGFYLLTGVAPGTRTVTLYVRGKLPTAKTGGVANGGLTTLDFGPTLANPIITN